MGIFPFSSMQDRLEAMDAATGRAQIRVRWMTGVSARGVVSSKLGQVGERNSYPILEPWPSVAAFPVSHKSGLIGRCPGDELRNPENVRGARRCQQAPLPGRHVR